MINKIYLININKEVNEIFKNFKYLFIYLVYFAFSFLPFFLIIRKSINPNYYYIQYLIILNIFILNNIMSSSINFFLKNTIKKNSYILLMPINLPFFVLFNQINIKSIILITLNILINLLILKVNCFSYFLTFVNVFFWLIIINQLSIYFKLYFKISLIPNQIFNLAKVPINLYPNTIKFLLLNILPLGIIVYFPIEVIIRKSINPILIYILISQVVLITINYYLMNIIFKNFEY